MYPELPNGKHGERRDCPCGGDEGHDQRKRNAARSGEDGECEHPGAEAGRGPEPPSAHERQDERDDGEASRVDEEAGVGGGSASERAGDVERIPPLADANAERSWAACERQRDMADPGDERCREYAERDRKRPPRPGADAGRREREEAQRRDRREQRAEREEERRAGLPPRHEQPGGGERRIEQGETRRDVAERQDRHGEREREPGPLAEERESRSGETEADRPAVGEERKGGARPAGERSRERRAREASCVGPARESHTGPLLAAAGAGHRAQLLRERAGRRPLLRVERQGAV